MNESSLLIKSIDNSIVSKETDINSSYESQTSKEIDLNNGIINVISLDLKDIINDNIPIDKFVKKDINMQKWIFQL